MAGADFDGGLRAFDAPDCRIMSRLSGPAGLKVPAILPGTGGFAGVNRQCAAIAVPVPAEAAAGRTVSRNVGGISGIRRAFYAASWQVKPRLAKDIAALKQRLAAASGLMQGNSVSDPRVQRVLRQFVLLYRKAMPSVLAAVSSAQERQSAQAFFDDGFFTPEDNRPADVKVFQSVTDRIAENRSRKDLSYKAMVMTDGGITAFNKGGDIIVVSDGFLPFGADEQAAVIAHEMGHLEKRHFIGQIAAQEINKALAPDLASADSAAAGGLAALYYARQCEYEADALAVRLMRAAGYDPQGLVSLLIKTDAGEPPDPASDHPSAAERIARLADGRY